MRRVEIEPRSDWESKIRTLGLLYNENLENQAWNEAAYYEFSSSQIEVIEKNTNELQQMCLSAVQHVIDADRFEDLRIQPEAVPWIKWSWEAAPPSIYGRFDLSFNGIDPPKLIEFNADTPTILLESAVIQWHWLEERFPEKDQFNMIWEALVTKWKELKDEGYIHDNLVHFCCGDSVEDYMTISALRDTAVQAGILTDALLMNEIGWDGIQFVDNRNRAMKTVFKLYPWEWMLEDDFGPHIYSCYERTQWIEPIWKMVLSNKGILPILWELYPDHPNLLPAYFDEPRDLLEYAEKPLLGREGANVRLALKDEEFFTDGSYGGQRNVYQAYSQLPVFQTSDAPVHALVGSWVVDEVSHGIGVRESLTPVTTNASPFVPHCFV